MRKVIRMTDFVRDGFGSIPCEVGVLLTLYRGTQKEVK